MISSSGMRGTGEKKCSPMTSRVNCLADVAEDCKALILVPVMDDVRKNVSIGPS